MSSIFSLVLSDLKHQDVILDVTQILALEDIQILYLSQSVIAGQGRLEMLLRSETSMVGQARVKKILEDYAVEHEMQLQLGAGSVENYCCKLAKQHAHRHILTLLGVSIHSTYLAKVVALFAERGYAIERITTRSEPTTDDEARLGCLELVLIGQQNHVEALRSELFALSHPVGVDIIIQADDIYRRNRRLVCFDMDSTLIQAEVIDELAAEAGVKDKVAAITASAMRGEMDFKESFRRRMGYLKGLSAEQVANISTRISLTAGAEQLLTVLHQLGYRTAILSGGFTFFAKQLQQRFDIDYVFAHELEYADGHLTGRILGDIVDGARKAELVQELASKEGISLQQVVAVGDGANDIPMLTLAGLGIAFHAKPKVMQKANNALASVGLDGILYVLGISEQDIRQLEICR